MEIFWYSPKGRLSMSFCSLEIWFILKFHFHHFLFLDRPHVVSIRKAKMMIQFGNLVCGGTFGKDSPSSFAIERIISSQSCKPCLSLTIIFSQEVPVVYNFQLALSSNVLLASRGHLREKYNAKHHLKILS